MLQIKKYSFLQKVSHNITFLFRSSRFKKIYFFKKKTPHSITLRSPKHFNIGKNKIVTVNSKAIKLFKKFNKKIQTSLIFAPDAVWLSSLKLISKNTTILPKNVTIVIKTKIKLCGWDFSIYRYN